MRLLAIDCSSRCTGITVAEKTKSGKVKLLLATEVKLKPENIENLLTLYNAVISVIDEYKPTHATLEGTFYSPKFGITPVQVLHEYHGVVRLACIFKAIPLVLPFLKASEIRKAVFNDGKLAKEECCKRICSFFQRPDLQSKGFDTSDSVCLALAVLGIKVP